MKSEVKYLPLWVLPVLFILLQKSGAKHTSCIDKKCGSKTLCDLKKCIVSAGANITYAAPYLITWRCFSSNPWTWNFGYFKDFLWTTKCCQMRVHVCYDTSSESDGDNGIVVTPTTAKSSGSNRDTETHNGHTVVASKSTTETTSSIRSVSVLATTSDAWSNDFDGDDFMTVSTMTMVQASPFEMNNAYSNQDQDGNTNIALKVALPVGIFLLVILLALLGFVFRRKVKGLMGKFRGPSGKNHNLLNPVYGINGPAVEDTAGDKFDNLTYAMQTGQDHIQSGNIPTGGYDYAKPVAQKNVGGEINENKSKTVGDSSVSKYQPQYEELRLGKPCDVYDTTYQTFNGESCNASYDHIMGSKAEIMTSPHARLGGTAYDNAAI